MYPGMFFFLHLDASAYFGLGGGSEFQAYPLPSSKQGSSLRDIASLYCKSRGKLALVNFDYCWLRRLVRSVDRVLGCGASARAFKVDHIRTVQLLVNISLFL
jgi:hypothetical protein